MEEKVTTPDGGFDGPAHLANFLKAVRSRKREDLTTDIAVGVASASLCHLAHISATGWAACSISTPGNSNSPALTRIPC
ncbi:MAG: hypothetical protein IT158_28935 [Bryobacterales bacterium]|nr:hypothetical protein [Bryobacterales bacterium]